MAAERVNIPPFGNWDGEEGGRYTEIFEKARKGGSHVTKMVNPNDPEGDAAEREVPERRTGEECLEFKRTAGSPSSNKHAQISGRGSSSPMLEGRATREGTPGRARLASSSRGDDHDKGVTVPKFGDWDDSNPRSGEGYTQLFTAVREERQGIVRSGNDGHIDSSAARRTNNTSKSKGGCGGCCRWLGI